jgi:hypothetical protein
MAKKKWGRKKGYKHSTATKIKIGKGVKTAFKKYSASSAHGFSNLLKGKRHRASGNAGLGNPRPETTKVKP